MLELLLRGPVLDLEHLGSRLFEPPEELLDADAPALAGFAHQHVHAPIRDGRRHPRGVNAVGRPPPGTTTGPRGASASERRQRRPRDVGAVPIRVDVRTPRRPHGTRIVGLGRDANRRVARDASAGESTPRRGGRSLERPDALDAAAHLAHGLASSSGPALPPRSPYSSRARRGRRAGPAWRERRPANVSR